MSKTKFNIGDTIKDHAEHEGIYAGEAINGHMMVRLDGDGWPPHGEERDLALKVCPKGLNLTGWYVDLDYCTLVKAPVREPSAPMTAAVLDLLRRKGAVTQVEAQAVLRCRSLARRILDLKHLGHKIVTEMKVDNTGQRYARYHLQVA